MSKESESKQAQGFIKKPEWPCCGNCHDYTSEMVDNGYGFLEEKIKRCDLGGFAVGKSDVCEKHSCISIKHSRDIVALLVKE